MDERPLKISLYSFDLPAQACAQLRLLLPLYHLRGQVEFAWEVKNNGEKYMLPQGTGADADLLVFQRGFPSPETAPIIEELLALGRPVLYEADDDLLNLPEGHPLKESADLNLEAIRAFLPRASGVTVSTPALARVFEPLASPVTVLPNLILGQAFPDEPRPPRGPVVVVYAGTVTHGPDLDILEACVRKTAERHGSRVVFKFYGCEPGFDPGPARVSFQPFDTGYLSYLRRLPRLGGHVALAPLRDLPFNRAKSDIKWLEYSAAGLAGIYADLPPYSGSIDPGRTGLLAGQDPEDWVRALDALVGDGELRLEMARQARAEVLARHSLESRAGEYLACWRKAAGKEE
jgi:glycosyltransferase involved in cell wall biosynthesis